MPKSQAEEVVPSEPQHGSPAIPSPPQEDEEPELPLEHPPQPQEKPDFSSIQRRLDSLENENRELRRQVQPRAPQPTEEVEEEEPDWEKELFANPKAAVRKMMDMAGKRVAKQLRAEYQQDRGRTEFWSGFYDRHSDLRNDRDLVELILDRNLKDLADMPVEKGYDRLAELTRERILRYVGSAGKLKSKARAEGASPPSGKKGAPKEPEEETVKSITDILKARARRRRGEAA
jgi:hypothetical protein